MANQRRVNENGEVFIELNSDKDVIQLKENPDKIYRDGLMKIENLIQAIKCKLLNITYHEWVKSNFKDRKKLINEGIECELLELASPTWKKGKIKVKVTLEFYPDEPEISEPESPLDEFRKTLNS